MYTPKEAEHGAKDQELTEAQTKDLTSSNFQNRSKKVKRPEQRKYRKKHVVGRSISGEVATKRRSQCRSKPSPNHTKSRKVTEFGGVGQKGMLLFKFHEFFEG